MAKRSKSYAAGMKMRRRWMGRAYVDKAFRDADDFTIDLQHFVTEHGWGASWGRGGLPLKTRSIMSLSMIFALNRPHELEIHLRAALRNGITKMLYVAPETLTKAENLELFSGLNISFFAVDEAHCISEWGHDFRPEYIQLSVLHELFPAVPRIALTATADELTRAEILSRLQLEEARVFVSSFDRPNIGYAIAEKSNAREQLLSFIRAEHDGDAGIVYCLSRRKVDETAAWLTEQGIPALPYHAGLEQATRARHQARFVNEIGRAHV